MNTYKFLLHFSKNKYTKTLSDGEFLKRDFYSVKMNSLKILWTKRYYS